MTDAYREGYNDGYNHDLVDDNYPPRCEADDAYNRGFMKGLRDFDLGYGFDTEK